MYTPTEWIDEVLAGDERYKIINDDGSPLVIGAEIVLTTAVTRQGTPVDATKMNHLEQGVKTLSDTLDPIAAKPLPSGDFVGTADVQTLINKRITPRISSSASSPILVINVETTDAVALTAQAENLIVDVPTGSPTHFQKLIIRIKDNGTVRTITWNAAFRAMGAILPTATVASKTTYCGFIYNLTDSRWDLVALAQEA